MDHLIGQLCPTDIGNGLSLCGHYGVAYQSDMSHSVPYGRQYFDKYVDYRKARRYGDVERVRGELVMSLQGIKNVIDIGIGCGAFIDWMAAHSTLVQMHGYDINPIGEQWLRETNRWLDPYSDKIPEGPMCWTMWDVLEHIPQPHLLFDKINVGDMLCVSIPVFEDLETDVPQSRHFRPDEHFYYWSIWGFVKWLGNYGLIVTGYNENETLAECGRVGIGTFTASKRW